MGADPLVGWALKPGATFQGKGVRVRINDQGLRGLEVRPRRDDEIRLLSLGDSSVFGAGVNDTFLDVAGGVVEQATGRPVSVVNGGVPGYASDQSVLLFQRVGDLAAPDWVIIANLWSDVYQVEERQEVEARYVDRVRGPARRIATYRLLRRLLEPWLVARQVGWLVRNDQLGDLEDGGRPTRVSLPAYVRNLHQMAEHARSLGARPLFLVLPAPMDLDDVPPPITVQRYRAAMGAVAEKERAPLVDGPEAFQEAEAPLGFFIDNVHPSEQGHQLLGVIVARRILEEIR